MTHHTFAHPPATERTLSKLHFCQFDADGRVVSANYDGAVGVGLDIPASIRAAYGVTPHADMPDGVHQRMAWRMEQEIASAGFYYCEDKDGAPVWISVGLYTIPTGILACHFEATSDGLAQMARFFAQVKQAERDGVPGEDTTGKILVHMVQTGETDYRAFATAIMIEEMSKRRKRRPRAQDKQLVVLHKMWSALKLIQEYGSGIGAISQGSKLIPYQLKLQAARLEGGRGPVSVIATNHQALTESLLQISTEIQNASATEINKLSDALAYLSQSNQAAELIEDSMAGLGETGAACVLDELGSIIDDCAMRVDAVVTKIDRSAGLLITLSHRMHRALTAMEMTRLMCTIERAKVDGPADGLGDIVKQLQSVEARLSYEMRQIDDAAKKVLGLMAQLNKGGARAAA